MIAKDVKSLSSSQKFGKLSAVVKADYVRAPSADWETALMRMRAGVETDVSGARRITRADSRCLRHTKPPSSHRYGQSSGRGVKTSIPVLFGANSRSERSFDTRELALLTPPGRLSRTDTPWRSRRRPIHSSTRRFNYSPDLIDVFCSRPFCPEGPSRRSSAPRRAAFSFVLASRLKVDFELLSLVAKLISVTLIN